jgi:hypothetical protein
MSERPSVADCWSCPTHAAVLDFAATAYESLVRRVIFRLQRIEASGIYGDDYQHKTLWDEYCHEVQQGPHQLLESIWEATVNPIFDAVIEVVPREEAILLTIRAVWDLDRENEMQEFKSLVAPDLIRDNLQRVVNKLASARGMSRFDPTMNR